MPHTGSSVTRRVAEPSLVGAHTASFITMYFLLPRVCVGATELELHVLSSHNSCIVLLKRHTEIAIALSISLKP